MRVQQNPSQLINRHWNGNGAVEVHAPGYRLNDEPKNCVARFYPRRQVGTTDEVDEAERNARLYCAAPGLLAACRYIDYAAGPNLAGVGDEEVIQVPVTAKALRELRAAIDNADGATVCEPN